MTSSLNQPLRIVIIGGVAGGASAATRARRVNAAAQITMIERGRYVSFANCGMPYHVGGEIESRDELLVVTPELFRQRFGIDVRLETNAVAIDRQANMVTVETGSGQQQIPYDRLILSPGAEPIRPPFVDVPLENVTTLWSLVDMDRINQQLEGKPSAKTVVVGGGFVGLEIAEQLLRRGMDCTLVERLPQVLTTLDAEMAAPLAESLRRGGIDLRLGASVQSIVSSGDRAVGVELDDETIPADLVVLSIGVRPRSQLAADAGLELGRSGGIRVDSSMRTSDPNIFAIGDCAEYQHAVLERPSLVPLAGPANRAGRVAGTIAAGGQGIEMRGVLGTSVVRVLESTAASTGLNQRQCQAEGIESRAVYIQATDHASYFPGAEAMLLKLVYSPTGKVLGAQAVGGSGVDKRIDVIATAMCHGASVDDLAGLDLAYAPPYGSAKDPVHMAAFVAQNDLAGRPKIVAPDQDLNGYQVVDVRSGNELDTLPIPEPGDSTQHIPIDQLIARISELDQSAPTITVCHSGKRAHVAASLLASSGFNDVSNLTGGVSMRKQFLDANENG